MKEENEQRKREFSTAGELRAGIDGKLKEPVDDVFPHAGKVEDRELMSFLNMCEIAYDNSTSYMPAEFQETNVGQMLTSISNTHKATTAVQEGNVSQMKYITGKQTYNQNANSIHVVRQMRERLDQDAYIQYLFGHMGKGKTDFAILEGEIDKKENGAEIGSNIKTFKEKDEYIHSYGDLLKWLANGQEVESVDEIVDREIDVGNKLFIFDEASSHASGYAQDAHETQSKLGTLTKKIRKVGGKMIIIGHTGKDVHPDIRRLAECVHKAQKKKVVYYEDVKDAEGRGEIMTIEQVPKTNWNSYETTEITSWDWGLATKEEKKQTGKEIGDNKEDIGKRNIEIAKKYLNNDDETYETLAAKYDLTPQRIGQIIEEVKEEALKMEGEI